MKKKPEMNTDKEIVSLNHGAIESFKKEHEGE
jgi:hypothetical protein